MAASNVPGLPFGASADDVEDLVIGAELEDRVASREGQIRRNLLQGVSETTIQWLIGLTLRVPVWAGVGALRTVLRTDQVDKAATLQAALLVVQSSMSSRFLAEAPIVPGQRWNLREARSR